MPPGILAAHETASSMDFAHSAGVLIDLLWLAYGCGSDSRECGSIGQFAFRSGRQRCGFGLVMVYRPAAVGFDGEA